MFDFSLVSPTYLWMLLVTFTVTYGLISTSIKRQDKHIAYVGVVVSGVIALAAASALQDVWLSMGLLIGALLIALIGTADESHKLSALRQLAWQVIIASAMVYFGWTVSHITNPFTDSLLFFHEGVGLNLLLSGSIWAVLWIVLMMNSMNWLDGMDGLAGGVSSVAFAVLAFISLLPATQDSRTFALALIGLGGTLAFLLWNFPPAKAYLGTSGSWFLGAYLALVAMIGGGKIATTLLVLSIPVLDALFVVLQRMMARQKPWVGDKKYHLHHRLLRIGFPPTLILILFVTISAALGFVAVTFQTTEKLWVFLAAAVMLAVSIWNIAHRKPRKTYTH